MLFLGYKLKMATLIKKLKKNPFFLSVSQNVLNLKQMLKMELKKIKKSDHELAGFSMVLRLRNIFLSIKYSKTQINLVSQYIFKLFSFPDEMWLPVQY